MYVCMYRVFPVHIAVNAGDSKLVTIIIMPSLGTIGTIGTYVCMLQGYTIHCSKEIHGLMPSVNGSSPHQRGMHANLN